MFFLFLWTYFFWTMLDIVSCSFVVLFLPYQRRPFVISLVPAVWSCFSPVHHKTNRPWPSLEIYIFIFIMSILAFRLPTQIKRSPSTRSLWSHVGCPADAGFCSSWSLLDGEADACSWFCVIRRGVKDCFGCGYGLMGQFMFPCFKIWVLFGCCFWFVCFLFYNEIMLLVCLYLTSCLCPVSCTLCVSPVLSVLPLSI